MGHVGPLFLGRECITVQAIVELTHAVGRMRHANENRGSYGDKGFDVPERDLETLHLAADFLDSL